MIQKTELNKSRGLQKLSIHNPVPHNAHPSVPSQYENYNLFCMDEPPFIPPKSGLSPVWYCVISYIRKVVALTSLYRFAENLEECSFSFLRVCVVKDFEIEVYKSSEISEDV